MLTVHEFAPGAHVYTVRVGELAATGLAAEGRRPSAWQIDGHFDGTRVGYYAARELGDDGIALAAALKAIEERRV
jgi:hypothetical protein